MTVTQRVSLALVGVTLMASPGAAQSQTVVLGEMVRRGQTIEVIDDRGRETRGEVGGVSPTSLRLTHDAVTTEISFDRIMQIARPNDTLSGRRRSPPDRAV